MTLYDLRMGIDDAFYAAQQLYEDLQRGAAKDAEQEIKGPAIDTVDAVLDACREFLPDHPIVSVFRTSCHPRP